MTDDHDSKPLTQASKPQTIVFEYTNYKGETSVRTVVPFGIHFGCTEWHPKAGWLLSAYDLGKKEKREFALKDCNFTHQEKSHG